MDNLIDTSISVFIFVMVCTVFITYSDYDATYFVVLCVGLISGYIVRIGQENDKQ